MKRIILVVIVAITLTLAATSSPAEVAIDQTLVSAIAKVESNENDSAVSRTGAGLGRFQIHNVVVVEVNRIYGTSYTHEDMKDATKAEDVLRKYLCHWGQRYENRTGRVAGNEVLARIWNGGPRGYEKSATLAYWRKLEVLL